MDIQAGVQTAVALVVVGVFLSIWAGIQSIRSGRKLAYYRLRQKRISQGWQLFALAVLLLGAAFWLENFSQPVIYQFYPASPTPSLTPTITPSPTITLTPTITDTPAITDTPLATSTPFVPAAVATQFTSLVTPNPGAVLSPLVFGESMDLKNYVPLDTGTTFQNPIKGIVAFYTYVNMIPGVQWTALWYRDGTLVHYETKPFGGSSGGRDYADWTPDPSQWLPGNYEVQIFIGMEWKIVGRFVVQGKPPTPRPTPRPSPTLTFTPTRMLSPTPRLTPTQVPSLTPLPSPTRQPSSTLKPSATPGPTDTPWPSATPTITRTPTPSRTPSPTTPA